MGFEVTYHFHERVEGDYNKEEKKTFKKKVGDPFEDVSLEKLAGAIMAQLARRDVWIVDVEVYELSKKTISFKEAKGGIILKNKKFLFDGGGEDASTVIVQDMIQAPPPQPYVSPQQNYAQQNNYAPSATNEHVNIQGQASHPSGGVNQMPHERGQPRRPVDWMVFAPELHMMQEVKTKNLRFTPDKRYPIYEKRVAPGGLSMGEVFVVVDDSNREQLVSDKYFVPAKVNLFADDQLGFSQSPQQRDGGKLLWGGVQAEPDMPDIRRR